MSEETPVEKQPTTDAEYAEALEVVHARLAAVRELEWHGGWRKGMRGFGGAGDLAQVQEDARRLANSLAAVAGHIESNRRRIRPEARPE